MSTPSEVDAPDEVAPYQAVATQDDQQDEPLPVPENEAEGDEDDDNDDK